MLWTPRTNDKHRKDVKAILRGTSKSSKAEIESKFGCRYTVLLQLPYFNPPQMLAIDPMHNLFLGTAKHILSIWLEHEYISRNDFKSIQCFVDGTEVPADVGRIPRKIETGFAGFTADQFKNWVTIYSVPSLYGHLPSEHLECWRRFVLACRILCKHNLSNDDVVLADTLLLQFSKKAQHLYGESAITPNMHMHDHLKEVILDFGPVYEFWLFSFERYNGILGSQPNNNRLIEPQLLCRFLRDNFVYGLNLPNELRDDFQSLISEVCTVGSIKDTCTLNLGHQSNYTMGSKYTKGVFTIEETMMLRNTCAQLQSCSSEDISMCQTFHK